MNAPRIAVGLQLGTQPPLAAVRAYVLAARLMRLNSLMVVDHFQNVFPSAIWDKELTWLAAHRCLLPGSLTSRGSSGTA